MAHKIKGSAYSGSTLDFVCLGQPTPINNILLQISGDRGVDLRILNLEIEMDDPTIPVAFDIIWADIEQVSPNQRDITIPMPEDDWFDFTSSVGEYGVLLPIQASCQKGVQGETYTAKIQITYKVRPDGFTPWDDVEESNSILQLAVDPPQDLVISVRMDQPGTVPPAPHLEIDDGNPVWNCLDIWTVPDGPLGPNGPGGPPIVGQPTWVWAKVHNRGDAQEPTATVRYWWANPATVMTRGTAHELDAEQVSLNPGETKEVVCDTPWTPSTDEAGHGCLICEIYSTNDPLMDFGDDRFHVADDRHVAQRNVTVKVQKSGESETSFTFEAAHDGSDEQEQETRIEVERVPTRTLPASLVKILGLERKLKRAREMDETKRFGLLYPKKKSKSAEKIIKTKFMPKERRKFALILKERIKPDEVALFHIKHYKGDTLLGGLSVLLMGEYIRKKKPHRIKK